MAYVINAPCIGTKNGACASVCPMDCIHPKPGTPDFDRVDQLFINPDECIDCYACVEECPVDAITYHGQQPAEWDEYPEKNRNYFLT
ncbi:4Fe-4S ferredoxin [Pseudonocardia sulfidoxydans NBRC 16205]|uniref:Ferredoxin n=1 Tax=Pseudonocardia sulfidoxydans NBRC 16205 TaxID=1223511 RepID=A0A511DRM9_9PSEU|nr:4Fe-4S binding protein [Pseudonocardia sulfidoxydans]GEL26873.1 4Fe-4S ferredoxin [Pseudonocardia sulfidoxydans NBRC 16205]